MSAGWAAQTGRWRNVGFAREVEEVALPATSQSSHSAAVAAGPQPRGTREGDAEHDAGTSSVTSTQVGDSWASSQALGNDTQEAVVNYRSCGAPYGAQDLSRVQDTFNRSKARVEEAINVDTG